MPLDMRHFSPQVLQAYPTDDFLVYAYFNDGSVHAVDMKPSIRPGTVFAPLADIDVFKSAITVLNETVAWDLTGRRDPADCIDIDPFVLFESDPVPDPLQDRDG
jgi:hypothetical protein